MTAEYTPDQTPPRQCSECGGLSGHTADCPNRVDDRAVVVAEVLDAVERVLRERLNEVMISAQSSLAEDRCEVLHPDEYSPERGECVECTEHAADLLHDGWDEQIVAPVLDAITALDGAPA